MQNLKNDALNTVDKSFSSQQQIWQAVVTKTGMETVKNPERLVCSEFKVKSVARVTRLYTAFTLQSNATDY